MPKKRFFKARFSGYISILLCITIPILFFGIKYVLDTSTKNAVKLEADVKEYHKKCAKKIALAVAQNWNSGLTLTQQKDAIMKIADAIYNASLNQDTSVLGKAIPGIDIKKDHKITSNSTFGGIVVTPQTIVSAPTTAIEYISKEKYSLKITSSSDSGGFCTWNPYFAMWRAIDKGTEPARRISDFDDIDEEKLKNNIFSLNHSDIYTGTSPSVSYGYMDSISYPTNTNYSNNSSGVNTSCYSKSKNIGSSMSTYSPKITLSYNSTGSYYTHHKYKERVNPSDLYCIQISISDDKIKAQTNIDTGYAVPAQCNVDIVLAIPTNGAANNIDNRDAASNTPGSPWYGRTSSTTYPTDVEKTPIRQIGLACKNFVKDNFYHIRGTNIGLIPYSAKVSISPDKTGYTVAIPQFVSTYFSNNTIASNVIRGIYLYGTRGEKNAKLTNLYNWNSNLVGCPIMSRRGTTATSAIYGNNTAFYGDLLSNANPSTTALQFHRMNLNPCYLGYANLLSLKCESNCTVFLPNPYYMIELTADLVKIYEMCNALYPIYDPYNVSNFIFIPVTWANNLFQSWTNNPSLSATTDQLSRPSKTTSGRKKALILIVNKPDWFEPGELTYIGFNNDMSEVPMIESDKINFAINYSDTTKKFLDGTSYDGTIQGAKKILKFNGNIIRSSSGYYESNGSNNSCALTFPAKGLVKLVLEPSINFSGISGKVVSSSSDSVTISGRAIVGGFKESNVSNLTDTQSSNRTDRIGGKEFGRNLSLQKLRIIRTGLKINNITLKNQILRKYTNYVFDANGLSASSPNYDPGVNVFNVYNISENSDEYDTYSAPAYIQCAFMGIKRGQIIVSQYRSGADPLQIYLYNVGVTDVTTSISGWDGISGTLIYNKNSSGNIFIKSSTFTSVSNNSYISMYRPSPSNRWVVHEILCMNLDEVVLDSNITSLKDTKLINNKAIALININGEEWVCFNGDGQLSFDVEPLISGTSGTLSFSNPSPNPITSATPPPTYTSPLPKEPKIESSNIAQLNNKTIDATKTYFIEPSEISSSTDSSGNYYITLNLTNVRLISAEITNRPYTKTATTCSISGTTNALNTSGTLKITTNLEAPMTIKAKTSPAGVTFYSDNGVEENINTYYPIDAGTTKTLTFSGPTRMYNWVDNTYTLSQYTTTGGKNFGHNLGLKKLKYKLDNATISSATLTNQILRYYAHYTYGSSDIGRKTLILNTDGHCTSETNSAYEQYTDPCISTTYENYNTITGWIWNTATGTNQRQIKAYNFYPICYGVQKVKFLMTAYGITSYGDRYLQMQVSGNTWPNISLIKNNNVYNVFDLTGQTSYYTDRVTVFTGRFQTSYTSARYYNAINDVSVSGYRQYSNNNGSESCNGDCSATCSGTILSSWANGPSGCACGGVCRYSTTCTKQYNSSGSETSNNCPSGYSLSQYSTSTGYVPARYDLNNFFFINTQTKSYNTSATLADIKANTYIGTQVSGSDTWLCFCGDGQLSVSVANPKQPGTIQYTTPQNTMGTTLVSKPDYQTITIDPSTHQYVKNHTDNTYTITLNVNNIAIDTSYNNNKGIAFAEDVEAYVYTHKHPDNTAYSRRFDWSTNPVSYGADLYLGAPYTNYIASRGYHSLHYSNCHPKFAARNYSGDITTFCSEYSYSPFMVYMNFTNNSAESLARGSFYAPGLIRKFVKNTRQHGLTYLYMDASASIDNNMSNLIVTEYTYPINAVLWNAKYQSNYTTTSNNAVSSVTAAACSKLKSDYSSNIRIYVIKYRKQTAYKTFPFYGVTQTDVNHSYATVDACATSSSYLYDISTETDLKNSLDKIAADIKTFAGYADAKNVD